MRDIVKIILYVLFVIVAISMVIFIAWALILANHIISGIVVITVMGIITGYLLAKRK